MILLEGEHQYNLLIEDGSKYTLFHNQAECWNESTKGTIAFEAENTGNEFKFKTEKKNMLNYSEAIYMYLILSLEKDYKLEIGEIIKEL